MQNTVAPNCPKALKGSSSFFAQLPKIAARVRRRCERLVSGDVMKGDECLV